MRRPGTSYLATLPAQCRLIPFIFSDDEVAIIVLSNNRMDVFLLNLFFLKIFSAAKKSVLKPYNFPFCFKIVFILPQDLEILSL